MTSDAKIGLLLGLVFIFIIAFIINGLPRFRGDKDNNELTTKMVSTQNNPPGIGAKERKVQESLTLTESAKDQTITENPASAADEKEDVRAIFPVPTGNSSVREILAGKTTDVFTPTAGKQVSQFKLPAPIVGPIAGDKADVNKPDVTAKAGWPKTYIVNDGDSLSVIAKKFYGEQEGNKKTSITRIFEANKNLLKSPDIVYAGQKIVIPAPAQSAEVGKKQGAFSSSMFEKVKSIAPKLPSTNDTKPKPSGEYVVKEGDNLWRIAAAQLGNGNRYKEISKLNADIVKDEDTLVVGMRLKLPSR
jgi:nucleoid-associated protein YgaU